MSWSFGLPEKEAPAQGVRRAGDAAPGGAGVLAERAICGCGQRLVCSGGTPVGRAGGGDPWPVSAASQPTV